MSLLLAFLLLAVVGAIVWALGIGVNLLAENQFVKGVSGVIGFTGCLVTIVFWPATVITGIVKFIQFVIAN